MRDIEEHRIERWTIDYGDGSDPETVTVPHAWKQDVPVIFEGPVTYRTTLEVPKLPVKLRFSGVSYAAEVSIDDVLVATHSGIWDAFEVPLLPYMGSRVEVCVEVTKNGGGTYPVKDVASGFIPYLYHTFGGIFGEVCLVDNCETLNMPAPELSRASVQGSRIFVEDVPFYPRGLLHWGWYPELGHANPPSDVIRKEVVAARELGFNLVKFCLWVPPHRYLQILKEEGMEAWLELPVWAPSPEPEKQEQIAQEVERIVRQYRHHDNILFWTVGCELGATVSPEFRSKLTQLIKNLTGSPLVKDNSGGAEMYGGDLREFGDYYDFHPYCDTQFYPAVLDSLLPGPRARMPLLLGEFNDSDVHRDLATLGNEIPYWASNLSELNDKGVRWQYDLPEVLTSNRFSLHPSREHHRSLMESTRQKALFIRKTVQEQVRSRDDISGYVITGWRDTPISTSGFFDDWEAKRFSDTECAPWNGPTVLFVIPDRRPPWVNGGNRPGFVDPFNQFVGTIFWKVGVHSEEPLNTGVVWRVLDSEEQVVASGATPYVYAEPLVSTELTQIVWNCKRAGHYRLEVEFGPAANSWPIFVTESLSENDRATWTTEDPDLLLGFQANSGRLHLATRPPTELRPGLVLLQAEGTKAKPFWRESGYEFRNATFWHHLPFLESWSCLLPISPDRVIDVAWLSSLGIPYETLLRRVDVRTYEEDPVVVRFGDTIITTLRPYGGLGTQPAGVASNPVGSALLRGIASIIAT